MKHLKLYGLLATLALGIVLASAQGGPPPGAQGGGGFGGPQGRMGGPGPRGMGGRGPEPLLARPDVQRELKLTEEQIEKLGPLLRPPMGQGGQGDFGGRPGDGPEVSGRRPGARGGGGHGGQGGGAAAGGMPQQGDRDLERRDGPPPGMMGPAAMDERLRGVLTDGQMMRLKELRLQRMGAAALTQKDVANEAGLSDAERQRIHGIIAEAMENMPRPEPGERPDPERMRRAHEEMREQVNAKILDSLSSAQRSKWQKMLGKSFKFDENWRPPQPPMQDRPQGGGGFGGGGYRG